MSDNNNKVFLAFDFGLTQIGLAVGQSLTKSVRPLSILKAKEGQPQWHEIQKILEEWQPNKVLVGLPLNIDGTESDMSIRARKFANRLHGRFGCQVELHDERLSSAEARSLVENDEVLEGSFGNKKKAPDKIDAIAAALILESWFEHNTQI